MLKNEGSKTGYIFGPIFIFQKELVLSSKWNCESPIEIVRTLVYDSYRIL